MEGKGLEGRGDAAGKKGIRMRFDMDQRLSASLWHPASGAATTYLVI